MTTGCALPVPVDRIVRMVNHSSEESQKKKIPSLDGLRAVSILLVLLSHSFKDVHPGQGLHHGLLAIVGACGANGVSVFFAISGFLITSLLIKERARFGKISLSGFYIRRAFRILPAFAAFILVMWILAHRGVISIDPHQFLYAITFTMDYMGHVGAPNDWFLGHVWSLSVEEQFYLLWPLLVVLCRKTTLIRIAAGVIILEPFLRVVTQFLWKSRGSQVLYMGHTRADILMFGCLVALLFDSARFQQFIAKMIRWRMPLIGAIFVLIVSPLLEIPLRAGYLYVAGYTLQGAFITLIILAVILQPGTSVGKVLNSRVLVHIGLISYSLYLWQELFMGSGGSAARVLMNVAFAFMAAETSYFLLERPMLGVRRRYERERLATSSLSEVTT